MLQIVFYLLINSDNKINTFLKLFNYKFEYLEALKENLFLDSK